MVTTGRGFLSSVGDPGKRLGRLGSRSLAETPLVVDPQGASQVLLQDGRGQPPGCCWPTALGSHHRPWKSPELG